MRFAKSVSGTMTDAIFKPKHRINEIERSKNYKATSILVVSGSTGIGKNGVALRFEQRHYVCPNGTSAASAVHVNISN
jgi:DNA helicase IV